MDPDGTVADPGTAGKNEAPAADSTPVQIPAEGGRSQPPRTTRAAEATPKKCRLSFAKDPRMFTTMANIYLRNQLWKKLQGQTVARWEAAMNEFYDQTDDTANLERKPARSFQQSFLTALENRIKGLPHEHGEVEPEHHAVCRKIVAARGDLDVVVLPPARTKESAHAAGTKEQTTKKGARLQFGRDDEMFLVMARIYLERKLYQKIRFQTNSRWTEAMDEFFDFHSMSEWVERKGDGIDATRGFKLSFEGGLENRLKNLPGEPPADGEEESKIIQICRQILNARGEESNTGDDNSNPNNTSRTKGRKRRRTTAGSIKVSGGELGDSAAVKDSTEGTPKRLARVPPFSKNDAVFCTFAKIYLKHELYKKVFRQTAQRWETAMNEFFQESDISDQLEPTKRDDRNFRHSFAASIEYRAKKLPLEPREGGESEAHRLCREILKARGEMVFEQVPRDGFHAEHEGHDGEDKNAPDNTSNADDDEHNPTTPKKRRRTTIDKRKIVPLDLNLTVEMMERIQAVQQNRTAERQAAEELAKAEASLQEAQKRLDEARVRKQQAAKQAERNASQVCEALLEESGPWNEMYNKLVVYKEKHGSFVVRGSTPEMKELRAWAQRQRDRTALSDGHTQKLPWYLVRNLDAIGFPWKIHEDAWWAQYRALVEYKAEHGDCMVPRGYKPNPSLGHWVKRMRYEAKKFQEDPSSVPTTSEQIKLLDDIGFVWENPNTLSWNQRWEELLKFKEEHGHCNVPKSYPANPKLVSWCQNQRAMRNAFLAGKKTFITAERISMLEDVGFEFTSKSSQSRVDTSRTKRTIVQSGEDCDSDQEEEEEPPENDEAAVGYPPQPPADSYRPSMQPGQYNAAAAAPGYYAPPLQYRDTNYYRFHYL